MSKLAQTCPVLSILIQTCPVFSKLVQTCPDMLKMKICKKLKNNCRSCTGFCWGGVGYHCSTFIHHCNLRCIASCKLWKKLPKHVQLWRRGRQSFYESFRSVADLKHLWQAQVYGGRVFRVTWTYRVSKKVSDCKLRHRDPVSVLGPFHALLYICIGYQDMSGT